MQIQSETCEIVYRHPKGRFNVVERRGKGRLGGEYRIRETVYPRPKQPKSALKPRSRERAPALKLPTGQKIKSVTERDKAQFAKLYKQGYSMMKIAKISGWSDMTVHKYLKLTGAIRKKQAATERDKTQFVELYRQGYSIEKIAATSGWSPATVFKYLKQTGLIRKQKKVTDREKTRIKKLAQNGATYADIAERLGISKQTVSANLHAMGYRRYGSTQKTKYV